MNSGEQLYQQDNTLTDSPLKRKNSLHRKRSVSNKVNSNSKLKLHNINNKPIEQSFSYNNDDQNNTGLSNQNSTKSPLKLNNQQSPVREKRCVTHMSMLNHNSYLNEKYHHNQQAQLGSKSQERIRNNSPRINNQNQAQQNEQQEQSDYHQGSLKERVMKFTASYHKLTVEEKQSTTYNIYTGHRGPFNPQKIEAVRRKRIKSKPNIVETSLPQIKQNAEQKIVQPPQKQEEIHYPSIQNNKQQSQSEVNFNSSDNPSESQEQNEQQQQEEQKQNQKEEEEKEDVIVDDKDIVYEEKEKEEEKEIVLPLQIDQKKKVSKLPNISHITEIDEELEEVEVLIDRKFEVQYVNREKLKKKDYDQIHIELIQKSMKAQDQINIYREKCEGKFDWILNRVHIYDLSDKEKFNVCAFGENQNKNETKNMVSSQIVFKFLIFRKYQSSKLNSILYNCLLEQQLNMSYNKENPCLQIKEKPCIVESQGQKTVIYGVEPYISMKQVIQHRYKQTNYYLEDELLAIFLNLLTTFQILQQKEVFHSNLNINNIVYCNESNKYKFKNYFDAQFSEEYSNQHQASQKMVSQSSFLRQISSSSQKLKQQQSNVSNNNIELGQAGQHICYSSYYLHPSLVQGKFQQDNFKKKFKYNVMIADLYALGVCFLIIKTLRLDQIFVLEAIEKLREKPQIELDDFLNNSDSLSDIIIQKLLQVKFDKEKQKNGEINTCNMNLVGQLIKCVKDFKSLTHSQIQFKENIKDYHNQEKESFEQYTRKMQLYSYIFKPLNCTLIGEEILQEFKANEVNHNQYLTISRYVSYDNYEQQNYEKVERSLSQYFKDIELVNYQDYETLAEDYNLYGNVKQLLGKDSEAYSQFINSLNNRLKTGNTLQIELVQIYSILGQCSLKLQQTKQSATFFKKAEDIYRRLPIQNSDDALFAAILNNLGDYYQKRKNYQKALQYLSESVMLKIKLFGEKDIRVAKVVYNMGMLCYAISKYQKSEDYLRKAIDIRYDIQGPIGENEEILKWTLSLVVVIQKQAQPKWKELSVQILDDTVRGMKKICNRKQLSWVAILKAFINLYLGAGEQSKAKKYLGEAQSLLSSLKIPEDPQMNLLKARIEGSKDEGLTHLQKAPQRNIQVNKILKRKKNIENSEIVKQINTMEQKNEPSKQKNIDIEIQLKVNQQMQSPLRKRTESQKKQRGGVQK